MVKVTFIDSDDSRKECQAELGFSLMEVAKNNGIEGIEADCGGACACAKSRMESGDVINDMV